MIIDTFYILSYTIVFLCQTAIIVCLLGAIALLIKEAINIYKEGFK